MRLATAVSFASLGGITITFGRRGWFHCLTADAPVRPAERAVVVNTRHVHPDSAAAIGGRKSEKSGRPRRTE
jgi:hypothetical protein